MVHIALPPAKFDVSQIVKVFSNRGVRLASFGYFGHMWELYGMWIWIPVMIRASLATQNGDPRLAELGSFHRYRRRRDWLRRRGSRLPIVWDEL